MATHDVVARHCHGTDKGLPDAFPARQCRWTDYNNVSVVAAITDADDGNVAATGVAGKSRSKVTLSPSKRRRTW